jgi:hypothetical protein
MRATYIINLLDYHCTGSKRQLQLELDYLPLVRPLLYLGVLLQKTFLIVLHDSLTRKFNLCVLLVSI